MCDGKWFSIQSWWTEFPSSAQEADMQCLGQSRTWNCDGGFVFRETTSTAWLNLIQSQGDLQGRGSTGSTLAQPSSEHLKQNKFLLATFYQFKVQLGDLVYQPFHTLPDTDFPLSPCQPSFFTLFLRILTKFSCNFKITRSPVPKD